MVYSHAFRFVPRSKRPSNRSALTTVSWTRSSASALLRVSLTAVPYNDSRCWSTSSLNVSGPAGGRRRNIGDTQAHKVNPGPWLVIPAWVVAGRVVHEGPPACPPHARRRSVYLPRT